MNRQNRTKSVLSLALVALTALSVLSIISGASALEDHEITTIMVLPSSGGTTSLSAGNHTYPNATALTMTAIPDAGFDFLYWNITGIMNTQDDHETMGNDPSDMEHSGPFGSLSDLDSLILTDPSVTITVDCAYTYQYQAFFAADPNATPTGISTQSSGENNLPIGLIVGIVAAVAVAGAIGGIVLKRKKTPSISTSP